MRFYVKIGREVLGRGDERQRLYECLGKAEITVNKVVRYRDVFFLITEENELDKFLNNANRVIFENAGFEVSPPPEYLTIRTVLLKGVDEYIHSKPDQEIIDNIHSNQPTFQISEVIRIPCS